VITKWKSLATRRSFFVRPCYPQLFEKIFGQITEYQNYPHEEGICGVIQTGCPGIGMSFSLTYYLWALAQRKQTVYFESQMLKCGWLFSLDGTVLEFKFKHMPLKLVTNPKLVYLFDASEITIGGPTREIAGYTILATSPKKDHYSDFRKTVQENRLYMPIWAEDEIAKYAADTIADAAIRRTVISCYLRFGGVARYVFGSQKGYARRLEGEIKNANLDLIKRSLTGYALEDMSHWIMHYDVDDSFESISMKFASKYVEDAVYGNVVQYQR